MTAMETRGERLARKHHHEPFTDNSLSRLDLYDRGLIEPPVDGPWAPFVIAVGAVVVLFVLPIVLWIVGA